MCGGVLLPWVQLQFDCLGLAIILDQFVMSSIILLLLLLCLTLSCKGDCWRVQSHTLLMQLQHARCILWIGVVCLHGCCSNLSFFFQFRVVHSFAAGSVAIVVLQALSRVIFDLFKAKRVVFGHHLALLYCFGCTNFGRRGVNSLCPS